MIIWYSRECSSCSGNRAIAKMKARCKYKGVDFEVRRTILWKKYEEEADSIMEITGVKLPFFYSTKSETVMEGNSFTTLDEIDKLIEEELKGKS